MAQKGNGGTGRRGMWENIYQTSSSLLRFQVIYWLLPSPHRHYLPFFFLLHSTFNSSCLPPSVSLFISLFYCLPPSPLFYSSDLVSGKIRIEMRLYEKYKEETIRFKCVRPHFCNVKNISLSFPQTSLIKKKRINPQTALQTKHFSLLNRARVCALQSVTVPNIQFNVSSTINKITITLFALFRLCLATSSRIATGIVYLWLPFYMYSNKLLNYIVNTTDMVFGYTI